MTPVPMNAREGIREKGEGRREKGGGRRDCRRPEG
jgi:hypothetical protein